MMYEVLDTVIILFFVVLFLLARQNTRRREKEMGRANSEHTWNPKEY